MADEALNIVGEVSVRRFEPGDKVILRTKGFFQIDAHRRFKEMVASTLGISAEDVLVLDGDMSIEIFHKDAA